MHYAARALLGGIAHYFVMLETSSEMSNGQYDYNPCKKNTPATVVAGVFKIAFLFFHCIFHHYIEEITIPKIFV